MRDKITEGLLGVLALLVVAALGLALGFGLVLLFDPGAL